MAGNGFKGERNAHIVAAAAAGGTYKQIAAREGISVTRVSQILQAAKRRDQRVAYIQQRDQHGQQ